MTTLGTTRTQETVLDIINLIAGVLFAISPWVFGFAGNTGAVAVHLIAGGVIAIVAIAELYLTGRLRIPADPLGGDRQRAARSIEHSAQLVSSR